jgi:hypothetical protein
MSEETINIEGSGGRPINITAEEGSTMTVNISSTFYSYSYPEWFDREIQKLAMEAMEAIGVKPVNP